MRPSLELTTAAVVNLVTEAQLENGKSYAIQMAGTNYAEVLLEERTDPADASTGVSSVHLYPRMIHGYECDHSKPAVAQVTVPYLPAKLRFSELP